VSSESEEGCQAFRLKAVRKKDKGSKEELGTPPERTLLHQLAGQAGVRYGRAGTWNQELFLPP